MKKALLLLSVLFFAAGKFNKKRVIKRKKNDVRMLPLIEQEHQHTFLLSRIR